MSRDEGPVIVIDDERDICELVQLTLEGLGFEVILSHSGEEGVELIRSRGDEIRLIMLDLAMPGVTGMDVLGIVRQEFPDVPVIIMSGYVVDRSEVAALGAVDVLPKPFMLSDVEERVKTAVGA